ncbi:hypothetical protein [Niabella sp.]|uniref:hypothetical protein n=1 Tax=Niabella sp. TaxID=1962976 RepID=UPI00262CC251|nr:hypothetical protein [Niabella sp.]
MKSRKLDFALVFAVNENQLNGILNEVMPCLKENTKFWVAHPKSTSKIVTDLNRDRSWCQLTDKGYSGMDSVELDHVWTATRFEKCCETERDSSARVKGKRRAELV